MSKHETWRTRKYWESVGGLLIEEFMLVAKSRDGKQAQRLLDGLIVLGEEKKLSNDHSHSIEGKDIIAVQTKANRLGMYLMGQAFFSRELLKSFNPKSIRTVAICGKGDEKMERLCKKQRIEVVVIPEKENPARA
tara:strand:+ start:284 stop:688 length:405 start_codon:yes stop_codon:yes gene_type:complete